MKVAGKSCLFITLTAVILSLLPGSGTAGEEGKIRVTVSVPPQAFFVERIGGDRVDVQIMIPRFASPATYEPTPRQVIDLEKSDLYVKVGAPSFLFEKKYMDPLLDRNRNIRVVDLSAGITYRTMESHHHGEDVHREEGDGNRHDPKDDGSARREETDPHVWVAPGIVRKAAGRIYEALSGIDPGHEAAYRANRNRFFADIDRLDGEIRNTLKGKEGLSFMVYHPAWGYFADEYGLVQIAIEQGGKTPDISRIRRMIDLAREKGIPIIFVQKGFDTKSARLIARETGGEVMEMDPLEKDWLDNLERLSEALERVLR